MPGTRVRSRRCQVGDAREPVTRDCMKEGATFVTKESLGYARPLIQGEVAVPIEGGLPKYIRLRRKRVPQKRPPR